MQEEWEYDPQAPQPTPEELAEQRAGQRPLPMVVHRRHSWDCSLVEVRTDLADEFFVLPFPPDQKLFDHDAGMVVGALDEKPLVEVGQPAPPLVIGHWLDGRERTLEELRGQVVVLEFWGLWCGACRHSLPELKALQTEFHDRPVTFISIHNAEKDPKALSTRIAEFAKTNGWNTIAAIDSGDMIENSVTSNAYGLKSFPQMVVVGPDGKVVYVTPYLDGPSCDEDDPAILAEFQKKLDAFLKGRCAAVGEPWPAPADLDAEGQAKLYRDVEQRFIAKQIEAALDAAK